MVNVSARHASKLHGSKSSGDPEADRTGRADARPVLFLVPALLATLRIVEIVVWDDRVEARIVLAGILPEVAIPAGMTGVQSQRVVGAAILVFAHPDSADINAPTPRTLGEQTEGRDTLFAIVVDPFAGKIYIEGHGRNVSDQGIAINFYGVGWLFGHDGILSVGVADGGGKTRRW